MPIVNLWFGNRAVRDQRRRRLWQHARDRLNNIYVLFTLMHCVIKWSHDTMHYLAQHEFILKTGFSISKSETDGLFESPLFFCRGLKPLRASHSAHELTFEKNKDTDIFSEGKENSLELKWSAMATWSQLVTSLNCNTPPTKIYSSQLIRGRMFLFTQKRISR